uniref:Neur_chan_LBD domain-containing protein n=1 Tax=Steinernema glaseri TaxID=37863 RepID=A0A1I8ACG7_9BILA
MKCHIGFVAFSLTVVLAESRRLFLNENGNFLPHVRLAKDLMDKKRYDNRVRPVVNHSIPTKVTFSMSLYQILAINEKQQNLDLNVWVIQKWNDEFLGWNPQKYGLINTTILPYENIWLPDTYLYNSVVMNREESERYINAVVNTQYWEHRRGAEVKFMYPALYRTTCRLDIRYFPYDQQNCTLIISSWTSSKSDIDYEAEFDNVNLDNFIPNEEWVIVSFKIRRIEEKFVCCPEPWVLLEASLVVRRKPLYYIVNLVIPTSVITLVAVTGFFTPASTSSERREKLSLGIDSLLAMSILMMMVSEQMPTTSDYVPLFGLFYLTIIVIIFVGTIFTAFILNIHLQKIHSRAMSPLVSYIFFHKMAGWLAIRPPTTLQELWSETGVRIGSYSVSNSPYSSRKKKASKKAVIGDREERKKKTKASSNNVSKEHLLNSAAPTPSSAAENVPPLRLNRLYKTNVDKPPISPRAPIDTVKPTSTSAPRPTASVAARNNWRRLATNASLKKKQDQGERSISNAGVDLQTSVMASRTTPMCLRSSLAALSAVDSTVIELKLRRRYALEWEFLATVLDRFLLILFSVIVCAVTLLMVAVGEAIHFSYTLNDDNN